MKELKEHKLLAQLDIGNTEVTDAGLKELNGLKKLSSLYLYGTKVTASGVKEIMRVLALPNSAIGHESMLSIMQGVEMEKP